MKVQFDKQMRCRVDRKNGDQLVSIVGDGDTPYYLVINGIEVKDFEVNEAEVDISRLRNEFGKGTRLKLTGNGRGPQKSIIEKVLYVDMYEEFPNAALTKIEYRNVNATPGLYIEKEVDNHFKLDASRVNKTYDKHAFWILQGGSYASRPDWILPVTDDFLCQNYQGMQEMIVKMNNKKKLVGGGLPILDVWCKETGFFIGSIREKPTLISLPAQVCEEGYLHIGIEYNRESLKFGKEIYRSIPTIIGIHDGDFYNGLKTYADVMAQKDLKMPVMEPSHSAYEPIWCGWGFGPDFTQKQMIDMIPVVKELGFKVVTLDDGWFYDNGDFVPRDDTFPNGDADMKQFVKTFHDHDLKIKLWVTWCIAGPKLQKEHPEWLLRDQDGEPIFFGHLDEKVASICPHLKDVQEYHRELVRKMIGDWDYDGFKVDQQMINTIGECYAVDHHHASPAESFEALPKIYQIVNEEVLKLKSDAIIEVCPCGVFPSFYKMPYYNQSVSSDFNSQWQIRHRGKIIKALKGSRAPYYGDHVERHYQETNFTSMIGVGGIPGTMFVSRPEDNVEFLRVKYPCYLSPERKEHFEKWLGIYQEHPLGRGEYLNLYDIAYDKPEAHVVKKDEVVHYAFYAPEWDGEIVFRGLEDQDYTIVDYVNNKEIGKIKGNGRLRIQFKDYLLVKAMLSP
jgi:alpha-galactosidase